VRVGDVGHYTSALQVTYARDVCLGLFW
jgi:hypothetical protein